MDTLSSTRIDRSEMLAWYAANRARTEQIYALVGPELYEHAPIPLRHPFVFYDGHIPAFSYTTLLRNALGRPSINRAFEVLFNRGIDPESVEEAAAHRRAEWPARSEVRAFGAACDAAVRDALANAAIDDPSNPQLEGAQAAWNILEHEEMHHETLIYILHRLPDECKRAGLDPVRDVMPTPRDPIAIPAGGATLGARRDRLRFGWDNEFSEHVVDVPAFNIDPYNVTNGEYLAFVRDGGPVPPFWIEIDGAWHLRAFGGTIPLPHSWPVYATNAQGNAFATWSGARMMTEPEYHRATYGTPSGEERAQPWGDAAPDASYGNFDFRRHDPEPIGSSPRGASAWGVHDLVGNGWEWTSTPFGPFPGFAPMASYQPYSIDFFDGDHYVIKGASPVTSRHLVRRSFRNWYRREYPNMYATFRRVWS